MKYLKLIILLPFIVGCSSLVPNLDLRPIKPPVSDQISKKLEPLNIEQIEQVEIPATPNKPKGKKIVENGKPYIGFDQPELKQLKKIVETAKTNEAIAQELKGSLTSTAKERNTIVEVAKEEEKRANFMAEKWAEAETELNREKAGRAMEGLVHKFIIGILGVLLLGTAL